MKLNSCKICGCKEFTVIRKTNGGRYKVICRFCGASSSSYNTKEEAITKWNNTICLIDKEVIDESTSNKTNLFRANGEQS